MKFRYVKEQVQENYLITCVRRKIAGYFRKRPENYWHKSSGTGDGLIFHAPSLLRIILIYFSQ